MLRGGRRSAASYEHPRQHASTIGFHPSIHVPENKLHGPCRVSAHKQPRIFCAQENDVPFLFSRSFVVMCFWNSQLHSGVGFLLYTTSHVFEGKHWLESFEMCKPGRPKQTFGVMNLWFHHMCYIMRNMTMKHLNGV